LNDTRGNIVNSSENRLQSHRYEITYRSTIISRLLVPTRYRQATD